MTVPAWTPDIVVDEVLARALLNAQFPELPARTIERLGQGWDNAAYLVDGAVVFRFPQRALSGPLIATEIAVLPRIADALPVAISAPRYAGRPHGAYPWAFAGYPLLPGTALDMARPDDAARRALAVPLATFLRALHALDVAPLMAAGLPPDLIGRLDPKRISDVRTRLALLTERGVVRRDDADTIMRAATADAPRERSPRTCVLHGDLYARHLLVDERGGLSGVIDWGDVHAGDPAVDLSVAHEILPRDAHAAFLAAYGEVDAATWRRARWRAIHHAVMVLEYGTAIGEDDLAAGALGALRRMELVA